jgi:hypothetical protein
VLASLVAAALIISYIPFNIITTGRTKSVIKICGEVREFLRLSGTFY